MNSEPVSAFAFYKQLNSAKVPEPKRRKREPKNAAGQPNKRYNGKSNNYKPGRGITTKHLKQNINNVKVDKQISVRSEKEKKFTKPVEVLVSPEQMQFGTEVNCAKQVDATVGIKKRKKTSNQSEITSRKQNQVDVNQGKRKKYVVERKKKIITTTQMKTSNDIQNKINKKILSDNAHSVEMGKELFQLILNPITLPDFLKSHWEKQPLCIKRKSPLYYSWLLSTEGIDQILRTQQLFFTKNIDVTSYSAADGRRETHNPEGQAHAPRVWDYYANGCSVRLLNPQTYFPQIHSLCERLQEYFGCFVGANAYLTPAGTQGFAPHYDDIEAFVLQVEGSKSWKLYGPRDQSEVLPRYSSENFREEDLGPEIYETVLEPGDLLYFPRGVIHQASALEDCHSLHITLSMYQKNTWTDLLEQLLPAALKLASEEDVSFREGLPIGCLSHVGLVHSDRSTAQRTQFLARLHTLLERLVEFAPVDDAIDQLGKRFMRDALPPALNGNVLERSVFGDGEHVRGGVVRNRAEFGLDTRIKLVRYNCLRLVREENTIRIYYTSSNSLEYHGNEPQFLEIEDEHAPVLEALIYNYPRYITVESLPINDDIVKVQIASDLWERGLLVTDVPVGGEQSDSD